MNKMIDMEENLEASIMVKAKIFDGFSNMECEELSNIFHMKVQQIKKGGMVQREGDIVKSIYIVHRGKVSGMKFYYEGDTHLLRTYGQGETFCVEIIASTFRTSPLTYIADEDSEILLLNIKTIFEKLVGNYRERFLFNLFRVLADDNIKLIYKTEVLSKRALRNRIMTYLLIQKDKKGTNNFHIMMNQEQFAQYLCVNRSALSYELNQMKREGILSFEKDYFIIINK